MGATPRYLVIVRRDRPDLYQHLCATVASETVRIILDRRDYTVFHPQATDRRRPLSLERDVRRRDYVIVRPQPVD